MIGKVRAWGRTGLPYLELCMLDFFLYLLSRCDDGIVHEFIVRERYRSENLPGETCLAATYPASQILFTHVPRAFFGVECVI